MLYRVYAWSFDSYRLDAQGGSRLQVRQLEAALPFYEKAARLAPRDSLACDALGNVYLQLKRLDDARATLEAGLAVAPATPSQLPISNSCSARTSPEPECSGTS